MVPREQVAATVEFQAGEGHGSVSIFQRSRWLLSSLEEGVEGRAVGQVGGHGAGDLGDGPARPLPAGTSEACEGWVRRARGGPENSAADACCPQWDKDPVFPTCQSGCKG